MPFFTTRMKFTWMQSYNRVILTVFLGVGLFFSGVNYGYNHHPEINKAVGVIHASDTASNTERVLETCTDAKGTEVPCLLNRDEVKVKNDDAADFDQFWKVWNIINDKYVPTKHKAVSNQEKVDRKSTRLNSSHLKLSRMPSSA